MLLKMPVPAMIKPRALYTGKQLLTTLVALLVAHFAPDSSLKGLTMAGKAKTPEWAYGEWSNEHKPLWFNGYLCRGVIDKNAIGEPGGGLVHTIFEVPLPRSCRFSLPRCFVWISVP